MPIVLNLLINSLFDLKKSVMQKKSHQISTNKLQVIFFFSLTFLDFVIEILCFQLFAANLNF